MASTFPTPSPPLALSPLLVPVHTRHGRHGRDRAATDVSPLWPVADPTERAMTSVLPSYLSRERSPREKPTRALQPPSAAMDAESKLAATVAKPPQPISR
jgi:hypothetical protein